MEGTPNTSSKQSNFRFTVIIPTLNEAKVIALCLDALAKSDFPHDSFEVVVVDNGSTDKTVELVRAFTGLKFVKVISVEGVHISALRNQGAGEARGEIFAFLDADCIPNPDWLVSADAIFNGKETGIVGAHYLVPEDATWVGRVWFDDRTSEKFGAVKYVPSGDLLMRRELFEQLGGFDESIQTNEDFELCQRARSSGASVNAYRELQVIHLGTPRTLLGFFRKQRWHGTHVFRVFLRDPQKRKNRRPVLLSLYTLLCLAGALVGGAIGVVTNEWRIAGIAILLLIAPLGIISVVRGALGRRWSQIAPLTVLYLTYAVARAVSVLNYRK